MTGNLYFLPAFFNVWLGRGDDPDYLKVDFQIDNENDFKYYIERDIKPVIESFDNGVQQKAKTALLVVLNSEGFDYESYYDMFLAPLPVPKPPRNLYVWVWEICFPDTSYEIDNHDSVNLIRDENDPDLIKLNTI